MKHIIIIGGGASGLVAAIMAARNGACVTVLERMQRVGKKLLATGNGRCNLSNRRLDSTHYHGARPVIGLALVREFVYAYAAVSPQDGKLNTMVASRMDT